VGAFSDNRRAWTIVVREGVVGHGVRLSLRGGRGKAVHDLADAGSPQDAYEVMP